MPRSWSVVDRAWNWPTEDTAKDENEQEIAMTMSNRDSHRYSFIDWRIWGNGHRLFIESSLGCTYNEIADWSTHW